MNITALSIKNIKRIREVEIRPAADRAIILIAGENAQGKSSILDALSMAFGGKAAIPPDPVNHDAGDGGAGEIKVELDGGKLTIRRKVDADGASTLEVRDDMGAVRSPQAILDKLVAGRFMDPLAFRMLKPADQRAELLRLIDRDGKVGELDARRQRVFDRRTELGRDLRKLSAQVDGMLAVDPAAVIDIAELAREAAELAEAVRVCDRLERDAAAASSELSTTRLVIVQAEQDLAKAQRILAELRAQAERQGAAVTSADAVAATARAATGDAITRRGEIQTKIRAAQSHNENVAQLRAREQERLRLVEGRDEIAAEVAKFGEELATIDATKAGILAAAALPVPGLGVSADGVTLAGVPLSQASGAEQLRVALGIAIAANPGLRDVWIKDGALLDDPSLAAVAEHAAATGCRVWIERVGTRDVGAITIHDGRVVEAPAPTNGAQRSLF